MLFAWVGVYLACVWLTGARGIASALQQLYFLDPTGDLHGRTGARRRGGTATSASCTRLGSDYRRPADRAAAAIFLAVAPLHVRDSHYVKHDVPVTLAVVAAYWR